MLGSTSDLTSFHYGMQRTGSPARLGPEATLVDAFISHSLPQPRADESCHVFIEPTLTTLVPDIVAVYWTPSITSDWPASRQGLRRIDLQIAHLLFVAGPLTHKKLRSIYSHRIDTAVQRLESADLITTRDHLVSLNPIALIFAIRRIMSFEAKISGISRALEQAYLNTWFASESYILINTRRPTGRTIGKAQSRGVGIWLAPGDETDAPVLEATYRSVPQSYASWVFNEMVWTAAREKDCEPSMDSEPISHNFFYRTTTT